MNRLSPCGGIQIEQGPSPRDDHRSDIANVGADSSAGRDASRVVGGAQDRARAGARASAAMQSLVDRVRGRRQADAHRARATRDAHGRKALISSSTLGREVVLLADVREGRRAQAGPMTITYASKPIAAGEITDTVVLDGGLFFQQLPVVDQARRVRPPTESTSWSPCRWSNSTTPVSPG